MRKTFGIFLLWAVASLAYCGEQPAQILDIGQPPPEAPRTITVQAAAPHVTVQAAPAPQVTVQAAPAPQVTVQAPPPASVTVQPANVTVPPAVVNTTVQPAKTDWDALLTQLASAFGVVAGAVLWIANAIKKHRAAGIEESDWQDLLAYAYQFANGDGFARLTNAFEIARQRYRQQYDADMPRADELAAQHGLAALHLEAVGPLKHDAGEELEREEAALKAQLLAVQARRGGVIAGLLCLVMLLSGCTATFQGDKLRQDQKASAEGAKISYRNMVDTFIGYYVSNENARVDELHANAVASHDAPTAEKIAAVTRQIKLADGTTIKSGDPADVAKILDGKAKIIAILEKQREANRAQVQRVAASMREKLMAGAIDIEHLIAITEGLKQYFATRTNTEATINASADQVLNLATQFIPTKKPK